MGPPPFQPNDIKHESSAWSGRRMTLGDPAISACSFPEGVAPPVWSFTLQSPLQHWPTQIVGSDIPGTEIRAVSAGPVSGSTEHRPKQGTMEWPRPKRLASQCLFLYCFGGVPLFSYIEPRLEPASVRLLRVGHLVPRVIVSSRFVWNVTWM